MQIDNKSRRGGQLLPGESGVQHTPLRLMIPGASRVEPEVGWN